MSLIQDTNASITNRFASTCRPACRSLLPTAAFSPSPTPAGVSAFQSPRAADRDMLPVPASTFNVAGFDGVEMSVDLGEAIDRGGMSSFAPSA